MSYLKKASKEALREADLLIESIKDHSIKKRTLPNTSKEYSIEAAVDSFKAMSEDKKFTYEIMKKAYESRQGNPGVMKCF